MDRTTHTKDVLKDVGKRLATNNFEEIGSSFDGSQKQWLYKFLSTDLDESEYFPKTR